MGIQHLTYAIGANTSQFKSKMNGLKSIAKSTGAGIAGALGASLSVGMAVAFTKRIVDLGDQIGKTAKKLGFGAEALQRWQFAAERSGTSLEGVEKGIRRMAKMINDAGHGMITYTRTLEELGLTYDDLKGKKPEEQFKIIISRMSLMTDHSKKLAIAQDIFGRSGSDLIPLINDYSNLTEEMENLAVMTDETIAAAERYKDAMTNLETAMVALVGNSGIVKWLADTASGIDEVVGSSKKLDKIGGETRGGAPESAFGHYIDYLAAGGNLGENTVISNIIGKKAAEQISNVIKVTNPLSMLSQVANGLGWGGTQPMSLKTTGISGEQVAKAQEERAQREKLQTSGTAGRISIIDKNLNTFFESLDKLSRESYLSDIDRELNNFFADEDLFKGEKNKEGGFGMEREASFDALHRIGGYISAPGATASLEKERNNLLKKIDSGINSIDRKTTEGGNAVWPS